MWTIEAPTTRLSMLLLLFLAMVFILAIGRARRITLVSCAFLALLFALNLCIARADELQAAFENPPPAARPWTFWYWNKGAISSDGITADIAAMRAAGLGGAYLMTIKGPDPKLWDPPVAQLTPAWWGMIRHAFTEADRLGLELAMHVCDGFATAGGPWITPEKSMQKVVWSETYISGGEKFDGKLPQPETNDGFYRDIATYAIPLPHNPDSPLPQITTSLPHVDASFLVVPQAEQRVRLDNSGWIQYEYAKPFVCRAITVHPDGNSFQANRLLVSVSDDGEHFREIGRLEPPRHGWQNGTGSVTHTIPVTTARFFRFNYDSAGTEPGGEDLDSAKWKPSLKLRSIQLCSQPRLHQFEGKNGSIWRVSPRTTSQQIATDVCIPVSEVLDISEHLAGDGTLTWQAPEGEWLILRMGHTSTGTHNETGGGARGLECDKFDAETVRLQFDSWFGEIIRQVGPQLAHRVLKGFHVDSWECGSQNWSTSFGQEFKRRRDYDLLPYLPVLAGIPLDSADVSERILFDVRQTIADLLDENFFGTLQDLAHQNGCWFSAECVAPTMVSDGMRHFRHVDRPMGEFWLRSPTHDKPNDMRDAISGAHVYGKPIVQAEAFTELRMAWDEHPGMLKRLSDLQFCLGANRLVYHVFNHNPWLDRRPGMTLDAIGLYSQRDQTWWPQAKVWTNYHSRCQALLQTGYPVVDIAVFTGEDIPSRAVLPHALVETLPGIFGKDAVEHEQTRFSNVGNPQREMPAGVTASANIPTPQDWLDPLRGYAYDSVNADALLQRAAVKDGRICFPGGSSYQLLVLPLPTRLNPHPELITPKLALKLGQMVQAGATIVASVHGRQSPSLTNYPEADAEIAGMLGEPPAEGKLVGERPGKVRQIGNGQIIYGPVTAESFAPFGIAPDFVCHSSEGIRLTDIAWNHRRSEIADWYFLSNQSDSARDVVASFRITGKQPEIWEPVSGEMRTATAWTVADGRTVVPVRLAPSGSVFVLFREATNASEAKTGNNWSTAETVSTLTPPWSVAFVSPFNASALESEFSQLTDWSKHEDESIRHFAGSATYRQQLIWNASATAQSAASDSAPRVWLDLGEVHNLATVTVNGTNCGTAWTPPYRVDITDVLHAGTNELEITVTNTWANRLIGDAGLSIERRQTWMTAPYPSADTKLLPAGLLGPVTIIKEYAN